MDPEDLLSGFRPAHRALRWARLLAIALMLATPRLAVAGSEDDVVIEEQERASTPSLFRPRRVTIGNSNHFMGVLGPKARYLYYVTDEYNAYDLFIQSPPNSNGKPLFEAFGDIVWPAISPDGKEVAYIRYEVDARGDACRRRIRSLGAARNDREECHETEDADLQIYWRRDGRLGVLLREELHGDHILLDGAFEKEPERKEANVVGLAISPDERWVAYVPLARLRDEVGVSFSNRAGAEGMRVRRALPGAKEFSYKAKLPGVSGYPVFSPDGVYLYFSQFLNDTNRDGVIDGDDNGVLFRMPFYGDGEEPRFGTPLQLTNARWNCHYPSVREKVMALTCAIDENLHIYFLPPSGTVPLDWDRGRITLEAESVHDPWSELVLRQHLLTAANDDAERAAQLKALTKLHLDLREHEAAIYYGERRIELLEAEGRSDWWSELMILVAKHRRADRALSRGRFSEEYVRESNGLADAVKSVATDPSADAEALQALVLSRIHSDLGDKAGAAQLLAQVNLTPLEDETVLDFAYQQFDQFYGLLADYDARLARLMEIALHPASSVTQSLRHAKGVLVLLQRGRPKAERQDRVVEARRTVPDGTRLALALDLEISLYRLTEENAKEVEGEIVRLYRDIENAHVRRYLVVSALRAANREGVESLQHSLVDLWVQSAEQSDSDRRTSSALYRLVVLERAYGAFAADDMETAALYFDRARRATDSLAGHVGWIETQFRLGRSDIVATDASQSEPTRQFIEAYLLARDLGPIESNQELVNTVERVRELLEPAIEDDPYQPLSHLLLAHALHHRGMRLGEREDVALAVRHYLLALDLGKSRPRIRAPAHAGMALAQASLGNHRRALEDYEARFELPMISAEEEFGLRLNYARSLFHVNRQEEAIDALTGALTEMNSGEGPSTLDPYQPLILDRLALYQLDAGKMDQALMTHEELRRSWEGRPEVGSAANEVKLDARLATAHLANEHPEDALRLATEGQTRLDAADPLRPKDIDRRVRPVTHEFVYDQGHLRVLLAGLEASAATKLDDLSQAQAALQVRKEAIERRYQAEEVDEDLLELAHTCLRLADVAQRQGELGRTQTYLEEGLGYAEQHTAATGSDVSVVGFHLLRAYALLHFEGGVDLLAYQRDLEQDLLRYYRFLSAVHNPEWETERMRFELFLSLLRMEQVPLEYD
ncbi:MAG: hypothetical protein WBG86_07850 [Polyangiales bacterium]